MVIMVVVDQLTLLWDNAGVLLALAGSIIGVIARETRRHGWNSAKIDKLVEYVNAAHDGIVSNHDKFVTLVKASTDLSPELKASLEAHGADIDKIVADSGIAKDKLQKILDEVNDLTDNVALKK